MPKPRCCSQSVEGLAIHVDQQNSWCILIPGSVEFDEVEVCSVRDSVVEVAVCEYFHICAAIIQGLRLFHCDQNGEFAALDSEIMLRTNFTGCALSVSFYTAADPWL